MTEINPPEVIDEDGRIQPVSDVQGSWMDGDPDELQKNLQNRSNNRAVLVTWIKDALKDGTDYGRIHVVKKDRCPQLKNTGECTTASHYSKPSLWKAGAEKIAGMLGLTATWPHLDQMLEQISKGVDVVALECHLIGPKGQIVSQGAGSRSVKHECGDSNKALKMAKKSSMIDAVLNVAGLSEVFTQDLESPIPTREALGKQPLDDDGIDLLSSVARELWPEHWKRALENLAKQRFQIKNGDWKKIPLNRLDEAANALRDRAKKLEAKES